MLDLAITGGTVVDGTGGPAYRADVGIAGGRVAAIGPGLGPARRVVDAEGAVVCPGFVDAHTHYDVQGFWDPTLSPSPLHGITTVVGGNCGFSVAPVDADGAEFLMRMLARVEGMPLETLERAVPWNWRSTAEFLDALEGRLAVNAGFMCGHSALRRAAMGPAASERAATYGEVDRMAALLAEGLAAGALGFSSSWAVSHHDGDGAPVPSRQALAVELAALAGRCRDVPGTAVGFSPSSGIGPFTEADVEVMVAMSLAAGRTVNWNLLSVTTDSEDIADQRLGASTVARARGARVVGLVLARNPGSRYTASSGVGLDGLPGWAPVMALPHDDKRRVLQDPDERRRLRASAEQPSGAAHHADWAGKVIVQVFHDELARFEGRSVGDIAAERGVDPFDAFLDLVCADDLRTSFVNRPRPDTDADWDVRVRVLRDERAVVGASDAGAHLDMVATFDFPSVLLGEVVRDRGLLTVEEAVRMLTSEPAALYGLQGRGTLAVGAAADVVVFDPGLVGTEDAVLRFDLPGGAGRLHAAGTGYRHVLVNGTEIVAGGRFTGATPGTVLRSGRDTATVPLPPPSR